MHKLIIENPRRVLICKTILRNSKRSGKTLQKVNPSAEALENLQAYIQYSEVCRVSQRGSGGVAAERPQWTASPGGLKRSIRHCAIPMAQENAGLGDLCPGCGKKKSLSNMMRHRNICKKWEELADKPAAVIITQWQAFQQEA